MIAAIMVFVGESPNQMVPTGTMKIAERTIDKTAAERSIMRMMSGENFINKRV
ncbi:hypothetical protein HMP0721_1549 [Pseudoramibacter alactolyticus ATCC 23263]|uniref:Uncharacterized protein n=1 Tax=Pseudoramibacter alactolyticus ATCC 23263 TaxID=887929 RepID=E6MHR4_9FIRM|nr:hypothetical protein HMP0721_1549 [Pseudoramibacter alactolyticus ATCC 23263]